jgi:uncharacterized Zn-finger protein
MADNGQWLRDLLDLDNWLESKGFISCGSLKCPYCERLIVPDREIKEKTAMFCPYCAKAFIVQLIDTPVGLAYSTRSPLKRPKP